jgi:ATP-dependent Clp protease protease subunit
MREIYLIDKKEDSSINHSVSYTFCKDLHELERKSSQEIIIHANTIGGDWDDGIAMFDAIKFSPCPITFIGYGCLCSMGTILIQAAKKRYLMPNCSFMVHLGSTSVDGQFQTVASTIDYYKRQMLFMLDLYSEKCQKGKYFKEKQFDKERTKNYIYRKLKEKSDWYMTAPEAVDYGFADKVLSKTEYVNARKLKQWQKET